MFDCQRAHISAEKRFEIILYLNVSMKGIYTLNQRGMTGHEEERVRFGTNFHLECFCIGCKAEFTMLLSSTTQ